MKTIGQTITAPISNCDGVKHLQCREEKSRFIVQGENFCKVYEKIKGINFSLNTMTNDITVTFDTSQIETYNKYGKFIDLIKMVQCHNEYTNEKLFWAKSIDTSLKINNIHDVINLEKQISYKTHIIHKNINIDLGPKYSCFIDNNDIKIYKKNTKDQMHKKTICGFIYDHSNNFLNNFNDNIKENENMSKNIVITDILPKIKNKQKFSFKNMQALSPQIILTNSRVIIYYPTEQVLEKINYLIDQNVHKPKNLWIVFPYNTSLSINFPEHFKLIANIIFWQSNIAIKNELSLTNVMYSNYPNLPEKTIKNVTNNIMIEKVSYRMNKIEEYVLNHTNNCLHMLDRLFFSNYGTKMPNQIYDLYNCPVCDNQFDEFCVKSYLSCGHEFCPACVIELINNKLSCPVCRKNIRCNAITISKFTSNKVKYLTKLFNRVFTGENENDGINDNILIYVDTLIMAKGLFTFINKELYPQNCRLKCCIVNQKNNNYKSCILICVKDKHSICKDIKNIKYIVVLTGTSDYILNPESLGYDYCYADQKVKIFLFVTQS